MADDQNQQPRREVWGGGVAYESYVGRWSRLVARQFLSWLNVPPGRCWLDVGCGTGALAQTILAVAAPIEVTGVDRSEGFVEYVRQQVPDQRARFEVGDAQALPVEDHHYDAAISGLVLNFVPRPERTVAEMRRAVRPGGRVALYVWDYAENMHFMRYFWDAAAELDPADAELDEGRRFPICQPGALSDLFQSADLMKVETRAIDVPTVFSSFDDYWLPFLGGQGAASAYAMSLAEGFRTALRERLRAWLPVQPDGSIHLIARAWAVRGTAQ